MPTARRLTRLAAAIVLVVAGTFAAPLAASADDTPPGVPTAHSFGGTPTIGAIFFGPLADGHGCSASVLASPSRDLIITAGHCISGSSRGALFVPGYVDGRTPYGVWTITAAYVDRHWQASGDTRYDYAILRIAPKRSHGRLIQLQDVTGGNRLGVAPRPGTPITDPAYNGGVDDKPITCTAPVYYTDGFPGFNCGNYQGGVSGSPFLVTGKHGMRTVVGVIGGLHQGGCYDFTSYSSPFTPAVFALLHRAAAHEKPDAVRPAGSDGC